MENMYELLLGWQSEQELVRVLECNEKTERFGLALSEEEAAKLMECRRDSLRKNGRVEFGGGILPKLIFAFCDSEYIEPQCYEETLEELQEIFYFFKNETCGKMTDDELIDFMREQFETSCYGDLEYLRSTCLERFARKIRSGYQSTARYIPRDEYSCGGHENEYLRFSEEAGWDFTVYAAKLEELED